jgi:hypothetical protein
MSTATTTSSHADHHHLVETQPLDLAELFESEALR